MSVDRRLRGGLRRNADVLDPQVDRLLDEVIRKARRRVLLRRAAVSIAAAAALVLVVAVGPSALRTLQDLRHRVPATRPTPTTASVQTLTGAFTRRLAADSAAIRSESMAGVWTIDLHDDGTMTVTAPPAFTGVLSGFQFQVTGDQFRTNLFIQDVCTNLPLGTYRWTRSGNALTFTAVDDQCTARVAFFTGASWHP